MNQQSDKFLPALYGGTIMALVSTIPILSFINCFCCAGILLGGFLAVFFYKSNLPPDAPPLIAGDCMMVGLYAGIVGALIGAGLSALFLAIFGNVAGEIIQKLIADMNLQLDADTMKRLEESTATSTTMKSTVIQLVTNLILYTIFGLLGGLIGYSVYKPKGMTTMPPPPAQPVS